MAVLHCISITATLRATPDSSSGSRPTIKIILPKKKPTRWSTGTAPGDYGGPPVSLKPQKYWGKDDDPLTSDDFIWNKDFMPRMLRLIRDPSDDHRSSLPSTPTDEDESYGFLSPSRVMNLDCMEVDLSKELMKRSRSVVEQPLDSSAKRIIKTASSIWKRAPTRREQDKWDRATNATIGGTEVLLQESRKSREDPEVLAAQAREEYFRLKMKMQLLTLGIGGVGLVSAYVSYSPEIAASFGAGLVGSLVYVRMLGNYVDSMGNGGLMKGAMGQPRLLVPVALVMLFNRWNAIIVPEYGYMHLQLIPMLVGFFTYKIATFYQAIEEAVTVVKKT